MEKKKIVLLVGVVMGAVGVLVGAGNGGGAAMEAARPCVDVQYVWARGSGQPFAEDYEGKHFKGAVKTRMQWSELAASYEVVDLDYPAIEVNPVAALFAWLSSGYAGQYGASVMDGESYLERHLRGELERCPEMRYALAGYSQGAHVVAGVLDDITDMADRVVYVGLLGEPRLYLPEGEGIWPFTPAACKGTESHSSYRVFVPNCYTHEGVLSAREPYIPPEWEGRVGLFCNDIDFICGSSPVPMDNKGHGAYVGHMMSMANLMVNKVGEVYPTRLVGTRQLSMSALMNFRGDMDVAILIRSVPHAWMGYALGPYKGEAMRLAGRVFRAGGRVALIQYGNTHTTGARVSCTFDCGEERLSAALADLKATSADGQFSALRAAAKLAYYTLDWRPGVPKAVVIMSGHTDYEGSGAFGADQRYVSEITYGFRRPDPINVYTVTTQCACGTEKLLADRGGGEAFTLGPFFGHDPESVLESEGGAAEAMSAAPMAAVAPMGSAAVVAPAVSGVAVAPAAGVAGVADNVLAHMAGKPVPVLGLQEYWAEVGDSLGFDASLSYGVGADIASYDWDFDGDGEYEVVDGGARVSWQYGERFAGYAVVRVTDAEGRAAMLTTRVNVGIEAPKREETWRPEGEYVEVEREDVESEVEEVGSGAEVGDGDVGGAGDGAGSGGGAVPEGSADMALGGVAAPNTGVVGDAMGGGGEFSVFVLGVLALAVVSVGFVRSWVAGKSEI